MEYDVAMITKSVIYVTRKAGGFYSVPRDLRNGMEYIAIDDIVGVVTIYGHRYLAFDSLLWNPAITAASQMESLGISICEIFKFADRYHSFLMNGVEHPHAMADAVIAFTDERAVRLPAFEHLADARARQLDEHLMHSLGCLSCREGVL